MTASTVVNKKAPTISGGGLWPSAGLARVPDQPSVSSVAGPSAGFRTYQSQDATVANAINALDFDPRGVWPVAVWVVPNFMSR